MELTQEQLELVELAKLVSPADVVAAKRALEPFVDPFWQALESAPFDDEPVSADDEAALLEAEAAFARGDATPHEEILREFGIK